MLPLILSLLSSESDEVAFRSAIILSETGELAPTSTLLNLACTLPPSCRWDWVIVVLGKLLVQDVVPDLEEVTRTNADLAPYAAIYLGWMGVRTCDSQLIQLLQGNDSDMSEAAARALAYPALKEVLFGNTDARIRETVAKAILEHCMGYRWLAQKAGRESRLLNPIAMSWSTGPYVSTLMNKRFVNHVGEAVLADDLIHVLLKTAVDDQHRMLCIHLTESLEKLASSDLIPGLKQALEREASSQVQGFLRNAIEVCEKSQREMKHGI